MDSRPIEVEPAGSDWTLPADAVETRDEPVEAAGLAGRPRAMVSPGQPGPVRMSGVIDREQIREVIRGHLDEIARCRESAGSHFEGLLSVELDIGEGGRVTRALVRPPEGGDAALAACVEAVLLSMVFPSPGPGGVVTISYPFRFEPAPP